MSNVPTTADLAYLRTPDACFQSLPDYPWQPHFIDALPSLRGLRMHYLDEGSPDAPLTYLCLHGNPAWSYLYRKMIPVFVAAGHRVIAPDLIGFGKSDKPLDTTAHTFSWHRQMLLEFIRAQDLRRVVLVVQDWGGILGLTLPMDEPERFCAVLIMNTILATGVEPLSPCFIAWREMCARNPEFNIARLMARSDNTLSSRECEAYMAPFPDARYRAATRAFPEMVPRNPDADGAAVSRLASEFWQKRWTGKSLMAVGMQDPVLGWDVMQALKTNIRNCPDAMQIAQGGHFVQEQGVAIAERAVDAFSTAAGSV